MTFVKRFVFKAVDGFSMSFDDCCRHLFAEVDLQLAQVSR